MAEGRDSGLYFPLVLLFTGLLAWAAKHAGPPETPAIPSEGESPASQNLAAELPTLRPSSEAVATRGAASKIKDKEGLKAPQKDGKVTK